MTGNQGLIPEREPERRLPHPRKAAGAQITQSPKGEVVTRRNNVVLIEWDDWNGSDLNPPSRNDWRASLVPASAVIPAPVAYMKFVAVEKLVVGARARPLRSRLVLALNGRAPTVEGRLLGFVVRDRSLAGLL